jgi:hypothetical protein
MVFEEGRGIDKYAETYAYWAEADHSRYTIEEAIASVHRSYVKWKRKLDHWDLCFQRLLMAGTPHAEAFEVTDNLYGSREAITAKTYRFAVTLEMLSDKYKGIGGAPWHAVDRVDAGE